MKEIGKSTLLRRNFTLAGFGFMDHPITKGRFIHIVFYKDKDDVVICLGDGEEPRRPELMRIFLGSQVPGHEIAPFAERCIQGVKSFEELKKTAVEIWPNASFEWMKSKAEKK